LLLLASREIAAAALQHFLERWEYGVHPLEARFSGA
jgi:hypothetical protein